MKNKKIGMISITVALILMLTVVSGLGQEKVLAAETRTVIDQNGREVEIPAEINRVVITAYPLPSIYYLLTGSVDKIVGIHPGAKSAAKTSIFGVMAPEILDKPSHFVQVTDLNMEEMLKLEPDLVIWWGLYANQIEQFDSGIVPAVAVKTQSGGNALETFESWIELMGMIFNLESRAETITSNAYKTLGEIYCKTSNIPQEEKPRALFLWRHSAEDITVPGKGHYGNFWLNSTGAIDVAEGISVSASVNMEQIYKWNPDIIYITSFTKYMPDDLINNTIEGQDWSKVKAVQDGKVYKLPLGIFRWYPPSGDIPLMAKWLAQKNHPELFADYTMEQEIKNYYLRFYHYDLSDEQVERILHPVPEAAEGT